MHSNHPLNIHLGEILCLEFLEPLDITPYRLSKDIDVAQTPLPPLTPKPLVESI